MKTHKTIPFILLFVLLLPLVKSQVPDSLLTYLKEQHPAVQFYRTYIQALQLRTPSEGLLPEPTLGIDYFPLPVVTRQGPQVLQFMLQQTIPPLQRLHLKQALTTTDAQAQQQLLTEMTQTLLKRFYILLGELYLYSQWQRLDSLAQTQMETYKELLYEEFSAGKSRPAQLYEIDIQLAKFRSAEETDSIQIQLKKQQLATLFNHRFDFSSFQVTQLPQFKDSLNNTIQNNSLIAYYQKESEKARLQSEMEKTKRIPQFSVGGRYLWIQPDQMGTGKDALIFPSLSLQIPLYQKFYKERAQSYLLQAKSLAYQAEKVEWDLREKWETNLHALSVIATQERETRYQLEKYSLLLDLLYEDYGSGKISYEEFLRAYLDWIQLQKEWFRLQVEEYKAKVELLYLVQELE